jgi:hypothetical protein
MRAGSARAASMTHKSGPIPAGSPAVTATSGSWEEADTCEEIDGLLL